MTMSKLEELMAQHQEMSPSEIARVEVKKVAEPTLKAALLMIVDLVDVYALGEGPSEAPDFVRSALPVAEVPDSYEERIDAALHARTPVEQVLRTGKEESKAKGK
jgi:hypothetical protein